MRGLLLLVLLSVACAPPPPPQDHVSPNPDITTPIHTHGWTAANVGIQGVVWLRHDATRRCWLVVSGAGMFGPTGMAMTETAPEVCQ